ncbi:M48 family metallopeptidase [Desulfosporosinus burensis]
MAYNQERIEFELRRKKVKKINLYIRPDLTVIVSASDNVPLDFIKDYVKEKAPWIFKTLSHFKQTQTEYQGTKEYVSGESFKYLGKQLRLKLEPSEDKDEKAQYVRGYLYLYVKNKDDYKRKERLINSWFRDRAACVFQESLAKMASSVEKFKIIKPQLMIRSMKARWGSCLKDKGFIILNSELIKAPKYCIEYVVLHELLHFKYRYHDRNFNDLMTVLMPDWKERKKILDEEVVRNL